MATREAGLCLQLSCMLMSVALCRMLGGWAQTQWPCGMPCPGSEQTSSASPNPRSRHALLSSQVLLDLGQAGFRMMPTAKSMTSVLHGCMQS